MKRQKENQRQTYEKWNKKENVLRILKLKRDVEQKRSIKEEDIEVTFRETDYRRRAEMITSKM